MTTKDEALQQALEAMNLARSAHGQMLMSDPPQEAWKARGVSDALTKAMTAIREALAEQPAQTKDMVFLGGWEAIPKEGGGTFMRPITQDPISKQPAQQPEHDRHIDQLVNLLEHREEIIDKLCDAVLGPDRYEWSSQYFFEDAVREVEERMVALAQPAQQQEPVAEVRRSMTGGNVGLSTYIVQIAEGYYPPGTKLYTSPPQRHPWVGLTENEISRIYIAWDETPGASWADYARAIEAKLKEKNT